MTRGPLIVLMIVALLSASDAAAARWGWPGAATFLFAFVAAAVLFAWGETRS